MITVMCKIQINGTLKVKQWWAPSITLIIPNLLCHRHNEKNKNKHA